MSESMSSPWIRDYLIDVAETHGVQLYNTPTSKGKKRVQLINFLTYHAESYVWAWISDKDYRVSVRFSKDAADAYKNEHRRNIFDCRFSLVFISNYRPIFSPRPLGPNAPGHTPVSHISLEVDRVSFIGIGAHLFGDPRDLESDQNIMEWILGLREDGGGGNVLKLRKQQKLVQNTNAPQAPPAPPPLVNEVSVSHHQTKKVAEDVAKPKPERPQDFKRAYAKRWRVIEVNAWKFAIKPAMEKTSAQTNPSRPLDEPLPGTAGQPSECSTSHCRTPSCTPLQQQGTPTDWSPSNRGSPTPCSLDEVGTSTLTEGIQQHCDEPVVSPTAPPPSDANGPIAEDTTSDTHSLQPPTPAQRVKRSPLPYSSPPHSSPETITCSSQLLSSPLPPSLSLPPPPSSFPLPMGIRKNFQRKVPHPGPPVPRPDPIKQGPVQILVPNSDTSGTGSSQSVSQSQPFSQSQRQPALPSSLAKELKPRDASLPIEDTPVKTFVDEFLPVNSDNEGQETTADSNHTTEPAEGSTEKYDSEPDQPFVPSAPGIEAPEVGNSDTRVQDTSEGNTNVDRYGNRSAVDNAKAPSTIRRSPSHQPSCLDLSPSKRDAVGSNHTSTQSSEQQPSRSSIHSLFSDSSQDGRTSSSQASKPLVNQTEVHGTISHTHGSRHDVEAWKEPSFIAKNKGKGKRTVEEPDTPTARVDKKRRRSVHPGTPLPKQPRVIAARKVASSMTAIGVFGDKDGQDTGASTVGKIHPNGQSSSGADPSFVPQSSKPRLAKFSVNFEKISLGRTVPIPEMRPHPDVKRLFLTTGRIRSNKKIEEDGSVYIYQ